jgi:integrase
MTGSLQIKDDFFYVVLNLKDEYGKRKQPWINTQLHVRGNKKKAEAFKNKLILEYQPEELVSTVDILFVDYIRQWLEFHKSQVDIITWQGYNENVQKQIIPYFEPMHLDIKDVTYEHIQKYYDDKFANGRCDGKGGLSARSVKLHSVVLNMVFKDAVLKNIIQENPLNTAKVPTQDKTFKGSFYTVQQANVLMEICKGQLMYPIIYMTLTYGFRRSEVMGLKWDAIDFENNTMVVKRTVVMYDTIEEKEKTKNQDSYRTYPLVDETKEILLKIKEEQSSNRILLGEGYSETGKGYVFTWPDGRMIRPDFVTKKLSKIIKKNGLPYIRFHDLRHSTASILLSKGWGIKEIQEWLGHKSIVTSNIYTHIDVSRKRSLAESMSNTFSVAEIETKC